MPSDLRRLLARLRALFRRPSFERDLEAEIEFHVELEAARLVRAGMEPDAAWAAAVRNLGGVEQMKEAVRDAKTLPWMETLAKDLVFARRLFARSPGFSALAVLTLALGAGSASAIFSIVNAVLLRPLPYRDSARLVIVRQRVAKISADRMRVPAPDSIVYSASAAFEAAGTMNTQSYDVSGSGTPEATQGERVSPGLFAMLGVQPAAGRMFTADDERVALLSYGYWSTRFGRDPGIVGRTILLNRQPYRIAGVMPASFVFPPNGMPAEKPADIYTPLRLSSDERQTYLDNPMYTVIGRLRRDLSIERAREILAADYRQVADAFPAELKAQLPPDLRVETMVAPFQEEVVNRSRRLLLLLLAAVGCLVAIACVNVAGMLLSRGAARTREIALRAALGAGRSRIVRQLLTESLLLSVAGGALGLLFAWMGLRWLVAVLPGDLPLTEQIRVDPWVLGFACGISALCGLLAGAVPALVASRVNLNEALKESGKGSGASRGLRFALEGLVLAETALALIMLAGAGLLIHSFVSLRASDPGFAPEHVLTFAVTLPQAQYDGKNAPRAFYERLLGQVSALAGVRAAGASSDLPYAGNWDRLYTVEGYQSERLPIMSNSLIMGDYFGALGIPVRRGRTFLTADRVGAPLVAVVNETFARRFWPGQDPIGRRIAAGTPRMKLPWYAVAGVVGDVKEGSPDRAAAPHVYLAHLQSDGFSWTRRMKFAVRAEGDPLALGNSIRAVVAGLDPELPVTNVQTVESILDERLSPRRLTMWLVTVFAIAALVLAGMGLYGVMAYSVAQRTHEIGIRMALGASRDAVVRMVVGQGMRLVAVGMLVGLGASLGLTRWMGSMLYGIGAADPVSYLGTVVVLAGIALVAHWVPARRAAGVVPGEALRCE